MKQALLFRCCLTTTLVHAQTLQELKAAAAAFPPMPRETADLIPFVQGAPTFGSGAPFNDLSFTLLDTDYMDGENSGGDVFLPVDPSVDFPGADRVRYIRCVTNTDLNEAYNSADRDRIILGTHEIDRPFFLKGADEIDNDYAVIQHLDFEAGAIQLRGTAADYELLYCTAADGCQTEGWYLFYTQGDNLDLIAFVFPCDDIAPPLSGNPPNNPNPLCNADKQLRLTDPTHFIFAEPISTTVAAPGGIAQLGSAGKEIVGGFTVDDAGNSYLFGATDGNLDGGAAAGNELFVAKVSADGTPLWVTELGAVRPSASSPPPAPAR